MGNDFLNKLAMFQKTEAEGKQRAGEFGQGLPVGTYIGKLQSITAGRGKTSGRLQVHREIMILEGEHANEVSHDWMGLEHPVAISIFTRYIEAHGFAMPSILDEKASTEQADFVYSQDLNDTLQAIQDGAPTYRIRIKQSGDFRNVDILTIEDLGGLNQSPSSTPDPDEPVAASEEEQPQHQVADEDVVEAPADPLLDTATQFCMDVGLDVADGMTLEDMKQLILGCAFPEIGVTAAQLKALGFEQDDGIRYDAEKVATIEELGCESAIIRKAVAKPVAAAKPTPRPAAPAPKPATKAKRK